MCRVLFSREITDGMKEFNVLISDRPSSPAMPSRTYGDAYLQFIRQIYGIDYILNARSLDDTARISIWVTMVEESSNACSLIIRRVTPNDFGAHLQFDGSRMRCILRNLDRYIIIKEQV
jgi:hypothetical protein